MKFIKKFIKKKNKEFLSHVSADIIKRCGTGKRISLEEYKEMRLNSYERKYIHPYLSEEALIWNIENALKFCLLEYSDWSLPATYDEYVATDGIRELLKRYKKVLEDNKEMENSRGMKEESSL